MSSTRKLFANAPCGRLVGSTAMGVTGIANAEPVAPLPIDAFRRRACRRWRAWACDSAGRADPYERRLDAHGRGGGVRGQHRGAVGLEERGGGGEQFVAQPRWRTSPRQARSRGPRRTCRRASTRPMPSGRCRRPLRHRLPMRHPCRPPRPCPHRRLHRTAAAACRGPPPTRGSVPTRRPRRTSCIRRSATGAWRTAATSGDGDLGGRACQDPEARPAAGQTAYVFTAMGTPGPAAEQKLPLNVTWVNLTTGKSGTATLKPQADINPAGPTTLTVIADTGSGSIMSTIFGQVTTTEKQCQFMPTIGSTVVP